MKTTTSPDTPKLATIRQAEQLIRELAAAASPGPWGVNPEDETQVLAVDGIEVADAFALSSRHLRATAVFIASWDPVAALAVADAMAWFLGIHWPKASSSWAAVHRDDEHHEGDPRCTEACVVDYVICNGCGTRECSEIRPMLTIALAYLGRDA